MVYIFNPPDTIARDSRCRAVPENCRPVSPAELVLRHPPPPPTLTGQCWCAPCCVMKCPAVSCRWHWQHCGTAPSRHTRTLKGMYVLLAFHTELLASSSANQKAWECGQGIMMGKLYFCVILGVGSGRQVSIAPFAVEYQCTLNPSGRHHCSMHFVMSCRYISSILLNSEPSSTIQSLVDRLEGEPRIKQPSESWCALFRDKGYSVGHETARQSIGETTPLGLVLS